MNRFNKDDCVLRSGVWYDDCADYFRVLYRLRHNPFDWYRSRGFRCVSLLDSIAAQRFVRIK